MTNQVQTRQVVDPLAVDLEQVPKIMQLNSGQETDVTGQKKKKESSYVVPKVLDR